jgi:hypothetical protein
MKWSVMLGLLWIGCGDDGADAPEGCAALSIEACGDDATCAVLELAPWDGSGACWKSAAAAACVPARATCATVIGCVVDGDGRRWFNDGDCVPEGWSETSGAACSGEPACD